MDESRAARLKKYVSDFGPQAERSIRVGTHRNLDPAECFIIFSWSDHFCCRIPYYFCLLELHRIEGEYSQIYGRTPWGPWCLVTLKNFHVVKTHHVEDPENNERIQFLLQYFNDFEER